MLIRNRAKGKVSENRYTKKKYIRNTKIDSVVLTVRYEMMKLCTGYV